MIAKLLALIVPLGLDTFAVAAALGMTRPGRQARLRLSLLFAACEGWMPLVGLALGAPLGHAIGAGADFLAIAVLLAFGLVTLCAGQREEDRVGELADARGSRALLLGLSVSLDELAIGFTLGLLRLPVAVVVALIALQAFTVTQLGLRVGHRLSERRREAAERLAGLTLIGLALVLAADRVLSS